MYHLCDKCTVFVFKDDHSRSQSLDSKIISGPVIQDSFGSIYRRFLSHIRAHVKFPAFLTVLGRSFLQIWFNSATVPLWITLSCALTSAPIRGCNSASSQPPLPPVWWCLHGEIERMVADERSQTSSSTWSGWKSVKHYPWPQQSVTRSEILSDLEMLQTHRGAPYRKSTQEHINLSSRKSVFWNERGQVKSNTGPSSDGFTRLRILR